MSHLVIHTPVDGTTQYRQFDDLASALQFIEHFGTPGLTTPAFSSYGRSRSR